MLSVKKEHDFKKALTQLGHQADVAEAERKRERQNRARDRTSLTPGSLTASANESLLFMDVSALDARIAQATFAFLYMQTCNHRAPTFCAA